LTKPPSWLYNVVGSSGHRNGTAAPTGILIFTVFIHEGSDDAATFVSILGLIVCLGVDSTFGIGAAARLPFADSRIAFDTARRLHSKRDRTSITNLLFCYLMRECRIMSSLEQQQRKTKLLYIKEILERYTDAEHDLTQAQIQEILDKKGLAPKTRTLHDDLESLQECLPDFGMELSNNVKLGKDKAHTLRYKVTKRLFTPTEVKLLMESVRGLKSLSAEHTAILIDKLSTLCSDAEAREIKKRFAIVGGFKAFWNKGRRYDLTLQAIETIDRAIDRDAKIQFRYFWYSMKHKATFPRDPSHRHTVTPLVRVLEGGYYYLIALNDDGNLHHYRLDRMTAIDILDQKRNIPPKSPWTTMNWKEYVNSSFGMGLTYPTEYLIGYHVPTPTTNLPITVTLQFTRDLVGVVMDRFGRDVILTPTDKGHFIATFQAYQNAQFMSWLVALGKKVQVVSPAEFRKDLSRFARRAGCWHNYNKSVVDNEYNAWKKRTPYWSRGDDDES